MFRNPTTDLIVVLVVVLLIFGPKRLPGIGRGLGEGMREFKDSITGGSKDTDAESEAGDHPALGAAPSAAPAPPPPAPASVPAEATVPVSNEPTAPSPTETATTPSPTEATAPERDAAEVGASERRS